MIGNPEHWQPRRASRLLGAVWIGILCALSASGDELYVVKRGDTLSSIARNHQISLMVLADRNGLSRSLHVYIGQRLVVPVKSNRPPAPQRDAGSGSAELPASVRRAIDQADVQPGRWKYIVIHHSGVDTGTVKAMDRYHREVRHMENGLAYHFVIGNGSGMGDGEVAVGARWTGQLDGGHLASEAQDRIALGICLVGNFDQTRPTARQLQSLTALVRSLMARCGLTPSAVKTHQQINIIGTRCPGRYFPTRSFLASLGTVDR